MHKSVAVCSLCAHHGYVTRSITMFGKLIVAVFIMYVALDIADKLVRYGIRKIKGVFYDSQVHPRRQGKQQ